MVYTNYFTDYDLIGFPYSIQELMILGGSVKTILTLN